MTRPSIAAIAAWLAAALAIVGTTRLPAPLVVLGLGLAAAGASYAVALSARATLTDVGVVTLLVVVAAGVASWRVVPLVDGDLRASVDRHAFVRADVVLTADPRPRDGTTSGSRRTDDGWVVDADVESYSTAGERVATDLPVQVIASGAAAQTLPGLLPGTRLHIAGRLLAADPLRGRAATVVAETATVAARAPPVQVAAGAVRDALRSSVDGRPAEVRGLLPGLVVGDTSAVDADLDQAMRDSGLAHLTAVSGGNVAVVVALVVIVGRLLGLRRGAPQLVVVALAVAAYVVIARPQPSVVRAAAMAAVVLVALLLDLRIRPLDALAFGVAGLVLLDPFLALSIGFAMSVLATAALVLVARRARLDEGPWWRRAWRAVLALVVVSAAAQLAVAPLVAGIGGGVPLGGIVANLLAEPAVAPATSLGLLAAVAGLVWPPLGAAVALPAGWAVQWIAMVARGTSSYAGSLPWPDGWSGGVGLAVVIALGATGLGLAHRYGGRLAKVCLGLAVATGLVVVAPPTYVPGAPMWPPPGWRIVMCDVGQGDATVLRVGEGEAIVVDTGPEPTLVDRCLRRLGVERVPLLLLTHFHADHVEGVRGVLHGRSVGLVVTSPLEDPPTEDERVRRWLADADVPWRVAAPGDAWHAGDVDLRVVWPSRLIRGQGSDPNNASVSVVGTVDGITMCLGGDLETAAQDALLASLTFAHVDVVKVPHHGSRHQSSSWAATFTPRIALIGVGQGNDYGHPAQVTLDQYRAVGALVGRTDLDGDLAVVSDGTGPPTLLARGR